MVPDHEKLEMLERVLSSEEFSHSQKNQQLLTYLVDASINNKEINETVIATEFFGKGSNFYPLEDASIRVNISQIRKRLSNYYLTEGKEDKIQIDIPKGNYAVRFCLKSKKHIGSNIMGLTKWIFPFITLILTIITIFLWIKYDRLLNKVQVIPNDNPVWAEYFADNKPILVILGDYFFMYLDRHGTNPRFNVRDPRINSLEDFNAYTMKGSNDIENLKPLRHTYLRPSAVWGFMELLPILKYNNSSFIVKQASETDWEDISSHNVIFIGTFKQLFLLKKLLKNMYVEFSIYPNYLYINNKNGEEVKKFSSTLIDETRQYDDVSLIAKINGPNNNKIIFITGFQEGGVIYGSKAICDPSFLAKLLGKQNNKRHSPFNFRAVLKVEGFLRSDLSSNIEYFEILSPDK